MPGVGGLVMGVATDGVVTGPGQIAAGRVGRGDSGKTPGPPLAEVAWIRTVPSSDRGPGQPLVAPNMSAVLLPST